MQCIIFLLSDCVVVVDLLLGRRLTCDQKVAGWVGRKCGAGRDCGTTPIALERHSLTWFRIA